MLGPGESHLRPERLAALPGRRLAAVSGSKPDGRRDLAAGTTNACVLRAAGAVHCFGGNAYGDMGNDYDGTDSTGGPDIDVDFSKIP